MKTLEDIVVGDTVLVVPTYRHHITKPPAELEVVEVKRVWFTVASGSHRERYRRDTGYGAGDPAQWRAFTAEQWAESRAVERLRDELRAAGFTVIGPRLSSSQYERVLEIVTES
jgi:hypothetical protein